MPDTDLEILNDVPETEEKPQEEVKPEATEEVKEEPEKKEEGEKKEEKKEEEEESEEAKDLPPHNKPSIAQIKEKFPNLFKEFPSLRDVYFREKEFSSLFPSVADAKEAAEDVEAFRILNTDILSGSGERLLQSIKETDETALTKFSKSFLPTLYKVSPEAHWQAVLPTLENLTRAFYAEGANSGNDNLKNAALHLSKYLFGDLKIATGEEKATPPEDKTEEIRRDERNKIQQDRSAQFTLEVHEGCYNAIKSQIEDSLKDVGLPKFVTQTMIDKIIEETGQQLKADKQHMAYMNSLWSKASSALTSAGKSQIIDAYLARARQVFPGIKARLLSEALPPSEGKKQPEVKGGGFAPSHSGQKISPRSVDWSKTSDRDFLDDRVTLRK